MGLLKFIVAVCIMAVLFPNEVDVRSFAILLAGFIAYSEGKK